MKTDLFKHIGPVLARALVKGIMHSSNNMEARPMKHVRNLMQPRSHIASVSYFMEPCVAPGAGPGARPTHTYRGVRRNLAKAVRNGKAARIAAEISR